jgi:L-lysine 2,3-aminomutase
LTRYCRYCTRSRIVGESQAQFGAADHDAQIAYIASTPEDEEAPA